MLAFIPIKNPVSANQNEILNNYILTYNSNRTGKVIDVFTFLPLAS